MTTSAWPSDKLSMQGLAKYDLLKSGRDALVGELSFGPHHIGGEAFFVPSHTDPAQCSGGRHSK